MRAAVIAGDPEDRDIFSFLLRRIGLTVASRGSIEQLGELLSPQPADLVVLADGANIILESGVEQVRLRTQAPLLLLAEKPTEEQHCRWLDCGADLVLARPLSPRLFSRYVNVLLRRAASVPASLLPVLQAGAVTLDPSNRTVTVGTGPGERLAPLEFRLLYLLMTNADQVIPVDMIIERVWGYEGHGSGELVRGLVRRLRRRIEPEPALPRYIHNIPGVGYCFTGD